MRRLDSGIHKLIKRIRVNRETRFNPSLSQQAKNFPNLRSFFNTASNEVAPRDGELRFRCVRQKAMGADKGGIIWSRAGFDLCEQKRIERGAPLGREQQDAQIIVRRWRANPVQRRQRGGGGRETLIFGVGKPQSSAKASGVLCSHDTERGEAKQGVILRAASGVDCRQPTEPSRIGEPDRLFHNAALAHRPNDCAGRGHGMMRRGDRRRRMVSADNQRIASDLSGANPLVGVNPTS